MQPAIDSHNERSRANAGIGSPAASVLLLLIVGTFGFVLIGPLVGFIAATPFIEGSALTFLENLQKGDYLPDMKTAFMVLQLGATFVGLAVFPAAYWFSIEKKNPLTLLKNSRVGGMTLLLSTLVVICFLPINSVVIEWNATISFPESMKGFEEWVRSTEAKAAGIIAVFTHFNSFGEFIFAFVVIAIAAGFSEELFFRGMLQPLMLKWTGNIHAAIWITAVLFSAMHLEFLGFFPRIFLGALFGYMYFWSGSLVLPMLAHMFNNGLQLILVYAAQKDVIQIDVDSTESLPPGIVIFSLLAFPLILRLFYKYFNPQNKIAVEQP